MVSVCNLFVITRLHSELHSAAVNHISVYILLLFYRLYCIQLMIVTQYSIGVNKNAKQSSTG